LRHRRGHRTDAEIPRHNEAERGGGLTGRRSSLRALPQAISEAADARLTGSAARSERWRRNIDAGRTK